MKEFSVTDSDGDILRVDGNKGIFISVNEYADSPDNPDAGATRIVELSPEAAVQLAENLLRRARKVKP
jgi:hypothetical protein